MPVSVDKDREPEESQTPDQGQAARVVREDERCEGIWDKILAGDEHEAKKHK
jgi:hypothetical protein